MKQEAVLSFNQMNFQIENNDHSQIDIQIAQINQEIYEDQNCVDQSQEQIPPSYTIRFAGYLGYGSKSWAAVWETVVFGFPVAFVVSQFLIYSIIIQINETFDIDDNVNALIGWSTVVGVTSVFHFVMQHSNEVFYRNQEGQIQKRDTVKTDLIKITILALLMMTVFIVSIVGGFLIAQKNGWNASLRFLNSLGAGLVGFIISVLIHVIWNKNCSILGIIIKPAI